MSDEATPAQPCEAWVALGPMRIQCAGLKDHEGPHSVTFRGISDTDHKRIDGQIVWTLVPYLRALPKVKDGP